MIRACLIVASWLLVASGAAAQGVADSYVELWFGPVIAPASIIGRGGVAVGIAEGAGEMQHNPAAVANRYRHTAHEWFDWDFSLDSLQIGAGGYGASDLGNSGGLVADYDALRGRMIAVVEEEFL